MSCNARIFKARSTRDALELVKRELGPDAVILGTRTLSATRLGPLAGGARVEITAAPPDTPSTAPRATRSRTAPTPRTAKPKLPQDLYPYYVRLVQNEVAEDIAARIVRQADSASNAGDDREQTLRTTLREYVARLAPECGPIKLSADSQRRIALVGPPGAGKTTTLAKLAAHFKLREKKRVALLSLDTARLAAHEQLRRYSEIIGVPLYTAQTIAEVKSCLQTLDDNQLLLIDTLGVGLREQARFARLATLLRAARADETHLVLPASVTPEIQSRTARGFKPFNISRVVLTHLDDAIGFGVVLNVVQRLRMGVSYISTGQNVPNDLEEACGQRIAELVCVSDE